LATVPEALSLAEQAAAAGDRPRAAHIYRQILLAVPGEPNALGALGLLACQAAQFEEAEALLRQAVAGNPSDPALWNNLSLALRELGRLEESAECCRRALALAPEIPELHNNLGVALKQAGEFGEAAAAFEQAVRLRPAYADAHYNLANVLVKLHRGAEAEASYRRAIELKPNDWEPYNNLGSLLQFQQRYEEARQCFDLALERDSQSAEAHRNRALLRLLLGDFAGGWDDFSWWRIPEVNHAVRRAPLWQGEPLAGKTILLVGEQGLGDILQFIRYAPLVRERGARVLVDCRREIRALLASAPGIDALVTDVEAETFDYYLPLFSCPYVFRTTLETIPWTGPYVAADAERVARWRSEFADVDAPVSPRLCRGIVRVGEDPSVAGGARENPPAEPGADPLRVGIAWQGNPKFSGDYHRSLPLKSLEPLARVPGVRLYSLQKGAGSEQLAEHGARLGIVDLGARLDNDGDAFVDTAAVMRHLDMVVTSDTAMAHLAGALGVPVWVALCWSPDWRWMLERSDSPWYPTMRLFRQPRLGAWDAVFAEMAAAAESLLASRRVS
jgi:Flp pilus assembly protein TadD